MSEAPSPSRIFLLRHGQCDVTRDDGALTQLGERQATALAATLGVSDADIVVTSPLRRAVATAAFLCGRPVVVESLAEFDFGPRAPVSGKIAESRDDLAVWRANDRFPGGETLRAFQRRVTRALERLAADQRDGRILVCTHAGVIDAALRWAYGLPDDADWVAEAAVPHASVTEIEYWPLGRHPEGAPRYAVIRRVGDVSHLPLDAVSGA